MRRCLSERNVSDRFGKLDVGAYTGLLPRWKFVEYTKTNVDTMTAVLSALGDVGGAAIGVAGVGKPSGFP